MSAELRAFESSSAGSDHVGGSGSAQPVAIVGIAARFPGAPDLARFWQLLVEGADAITVTDRQARPGGFLRDVTGMDAGLFATSAAEAATMDPQQRLLLELAWEAVEDSRTSPRAQCGRPVGVYIGAMHGDYEVLSSTTAPTRHSLTGLNRGMLANRISHFLGLRGPSLTVDAGQASSLVAVHLAVQSIRQGECEEALAGGVNLLLDEHETDIAEQFGALSPDHKCFTFDERANGYVRGEGGALVALKSLAAAVAAGDRIYAVIHGSAVNNDGATSDHLTAPSVDAQAEVLRAAVENAGLRADQIGYVELHGTGTPVGDPVEAAALGRVYGTAAGRDGQLLVGSVKTNIGHLEGAAGIAGLVKTALVLRHGEIPPNRNFRSASPRIPLGMLGLEVVQARLRWQVAGTAYAGVSSFGMAGVNCHLVLSSAPVRKTATGVRDASGTDRERALPFVLSAAGPEALRQRASQLSESVVATADLDALAYSLHATRARHDHRAVIIGRDRDEVTRGLAAVASGDHAPQVISGRVARTDRGAAGRLAFVFPGQGAQKPAMARSLYRAVPEFAAHLDRVAGYFTPHLDVDLLDLLIEVGETASALLDQTRYTQPALFAVELALFDFVRDLGIQADYLIGHSIGELVAATASGAFAPADAARLVAERGRLMQSAPAGGAMVAIAVGEQELSVYRETTGAEFDIAAVNHRQATVISGDAATVAEVGAVFAGQGHRTTKLTVSHAFHSAHLDPVLDEFRKVVAGTVVHRLGTPVASNVTGELLTDADLADPDYLVRQLRRTVRFGAGVETLLDRETTCFLELGPGAGLSSMIRAAPGVEAGGRSIATVPALRDGAVDADGLLEVLAELECAGVGVDWTGSITSRRRIDLPTYPFQRKPYWVEGAATSAVPAQSTSAPTSLPVGVPEPSSASVQPDATRVVDAGLSRVLGLTAPTDDELHSDFKALGLDSLGAVRFRDIVSEVSGLTLPASLAYDYPTPRAVITLVAELLAAGDGTAATQQAFGVPAVEDIPERALVSDDDVVIVSTAGRWPGGLDSPEQFWAALCAGRDLTGELPTDREWDLGALSDTGPAGPRGTRHGGFLYDAAEFDAAFFGIGPREAEAMDPQQRLLLESAWTCLQRAGLAPSSLRGSATGVYIGAVQQEYGPRMHEAGSSAAGYLLTGTTNSVLSGRLAYHFGFAGPALTIDTACSSSLVALHLAVRALRNRECDLAVVGGVSVMSTPGMFTEFGKQGGLAADGRCKPFADDADGTVWAEAVATVLVERRADALRAGHRILAVVRGSAINSDGASNGLTAPSGPAQQRVITAALADARLPASAVDVVEAHGTGTALGDPIEAEALRATYGRAHTAQRPVLIGSAKSNIGHTQAAAGLTGVVKLIGALHAAVVPPTINVTAPSRLVDWSTAHLHIPTSNPVPWPSSDLPRTAAISSFGISGTNAHVILQLPDRAETGRPLVAGLPVPLVFSARSPQSLRAYAASLLEAVDIDELDAVDDGFAAVADELHRVDEGFAHRAVVRPVTGEVGAALAAVAEGTRRPGAAVAEPPEGKRLRAFVFSGQGSQRVGMGVRFAAAVPAFATELTAVLARLDPHLSQPLAPVLDGTAGDELLHRTRFAQPAIFAFEVAMYRWLERLGLRADFVTGHSVGEIAAAHVAGVLSLDDACRLVAARGRLMDEIDADGAMAALAATESEVSHALDGRTEVAIAAVNGPRATVISGDRQVVEELVAAFRADGRKAQRLTVSHAFHSQHMDAMTDEFRAVVATVRIEEPRIALVSGLTGRIVASAAEFGDDYWVRHARHAVRFADAVRTLHDSGVRTFVEIGPDAVLLPMITQSVSEPIVVVPTTTRRADEPTAVVRALEALYLDGAEVRWSALRDSRPIDAAPLPTYAFTRTRFWSGAGDTGRAHPFLGPVARSADGGLLLTGTVSLGTAAWLADHVVGSAAIFPGTGFLDLALYTALVAGVDEVVELDLMAPMTIDESDRMVEVTAAPEDHTGTRTVSIRSRTATTEWTTHATGILGRRDERYHADEAEGELTVPREAVADLYHQLATDGYRYGPAFRNLRHLDTVVNAPARRRATLELDRPIATAGGHRIHPALLDAALHPLVAALLDAGSGPVVPAQFRGVRVISQPTGPVIADLERTGRFRAGIRLGTPAGRTLAEIDAVTFLPATLPAGPDADLPGRLVWQPAEPINGTARGEVAVLGGAAGSATVAELRTSLREGLPTPTVVLAASPTTSSTRVCWSDAGPVTAGAASPEALARSSIVTTTHRRVTETIALLREWVSDEVFAGTQLAVVVENSADVADEVAGQALAGLVRSAQQEWPGRFRLVDADAVATGEQIARALETSADPEITVRDGHVQRATVEPVRVPDSSGRVADPFSGTVLVTGASGALARVVARHLVTAHGARRLLLVSRGSVGPDLVTELEHLGAEVRTAACDVAEAAQVSELLAGIDETAPLTAVFHLAGVLDDAALTTVEPDQLTSVLRPKVDGAWNLHEQTAALTGLGAFVLFSSMVATTGNPGQTGYGAANAFLDALARLRHRAGLPATSIGWGFWESVDGMGSALTATELARLRRSGVGALTVEQGMRYLDVALVAREPHVLATPTWPTTIRSWSSRMPAPTAPPSRVGTVVSDPRPRNENHVATLPPAERKQAVIALIRTAVAQALGFSSGSEVDPRRGFLDMGVDSLAAVELRNQLAQTLGLRLSATALIDYPTVEHLGEHVTDQLADSERSDSTPVSDPDDPGDIAGLITHLERVNRDRSTIGPGDHDRLLAQLRLLTATVGRAQATGGLDVATDDEIFDLIDNELGLSRDEAL